MNNSGFENTDTPSIEKRLFSPPLDVIEHANITSYIQSKGFNDYEAFHKWSLEHPTKFWDDQAKQLHWFQTWNTTFQWTDKPSFQWFTGGKFNIVYNCLDCHMQTTTRTRVAYYWEADDGATRAITYEQLYQMTNQLAQGLQNLGVQKGDRVAIYLPMIPELPAAMLAAARLGAVHLLICAGLPAATLRDCMLNAEAKVLITADGNYRGGRYVNLKKLADEAVAETPAIEKTVVVRRLGNDVPMQAGRDIFWDELLLAIPEDVFVPCEHMDSEDLLSILYTNSSTGQPKGAVHVQAGYAVGVYATTKFIFDVKESDVYWCATELAWGIGQSYIVYGPLLSGITSVLFEGTPVYPAPDRLWRIVEKFKVTILATSPTVIRGLMRFGEGWPAKHNLSSLRLLATVGEPINPEAWLWCYHNLGHDKLPLINSWWQSETGMILITPTLQLPLKPGSASRPFPTVEADIVNKEGQPVQVEQSGFLIIRHPWPAQVRDIYKDPACYATYWSKPYNDNTIATLYWTSNTATVDKDGYFRMQGCVDDVINVSGEHLNSMEIESSLVAHPSVAEAIAIGKPDPHKGEHVKVFVILKQGFAPSKQLEKDLKAHVRTMVCGQAVPDELEFVPSLPKIGTGKIMQRIIGSLELSILGV